MKKTLFYFLVFVLSIGIVYSNGEHDFTEAKKLIDAKTPCSKLTDAQLEMIGDYAMEQMHPGQAHEAMDKMMGGEGSESLRLMHIAMAKRWYCNDVSDSVNYGMMGSGMINSGYGKKGGMMNMMMGSNFGYGMMGNYGYGYLSFINLLSIVLLIGLVVLVYLWIIKLWKEAFTKTKK